MCVGTQENIRSFPSAGVQYLDCQFSLNSAVLFDSYTLDGVPLSWRTELEREYDYFSPDR